MAIFGLQFRVVSNDIYQDNRRLLGKSYYISRWYALVEFLEKVWEKVVHTMTFADRFADIDRKQYSSLCLDSCGTGKLLVISQVFYTA